MVVGLHTFAEAFTVLLLTFLSELDGCNCKECGQNQGQRDALGKNTQEFFCTSENN